MKNMTEDEINRHINNTIVSFELENQYLSEHDIADMKDILHGKLSAEESIKREIDNFFLNMV